MGFNLSKQKLPEQTLNMMIERAQKGLHVSSPPLGYRVGYKNGESTIILDNCIYPFVKDLFSIYSSGFISINSLLKKCGEKHNVGLGRDTVKYVFKNKFYIGYITLNGKEYRHGYPTFISEDLFNKVQNIIQTAKSRHTSFKGKQFIYRQILKCEQCGCILTPSIDKNSTFYRCSRQKRSAFKSIHKAIGNLKEDAVNKVIHEYCLQYDINFEELTKDPYKMKIFCSQIFSSLMGRGKELIYSLKSNPPTKKQLKNFIDNPSLLITNVVNTEKQEISNPLLEYLIQPRSLEDIMKHMGKNLEEVQSLLFDYQLEGLIDENESGLWVKNQ